MGGTWTRFRSELTFLGLSLLIMVDLPELSRPTMMIFDFFFPKAPPIIIIITMRARSCHVFAF